MAYGSGWRKDVVKQCVEFDTGQDLFKLKASQQVAIPRSWCTQAAT